MEKKIENYLHFYLGCQIKATGLKSLAKLDSVDTYFTNPVRISVGDTVTSRPFNQVKPLLRPLPSMTEEEAEQLHLIEFPNEEIISGKSLRDLYINEPYRTPNQLVLLLFLHFDLFGLIEAGLALDKTKMGEK